MTCKKNRRDKQNQNNKRKQKTTKAKECVISEHVTEVCVLLSVCLFVCLFLCVDGEIEKRELVGDRLVVVL